MMRILCCTKRNVHLFDGLNPYADQARLRYEAFRRLDWDVAYFDDLRWEEDEYDVSPHTEYIVCYDGNRAVGSGRMVRTDDVFNLGQQQKTFMLKDVFSGHANDPKKLVSKEVLESGERVLEGTRFVVSKYLSKAEVKEVVSHIAVATIQRCLDRDIDTIVGVMPPGVWRSVWEKRGCSPSWLGNEVDLGVDGTVRAGRLEVSYEALEAVQEKTGIHDLEIDVGTKTVNGHGFSFADDLPMVVNS